MSPPATCGARHQPLRSMHLPYRYKLDDKGARALDEGNSRSTESDRVLDEKDLLALKTNIAKGIGVKDPREIDVQQGPGRARRAGGPGADPRPDGCGTSPCGT